MPRIKQQNRIGWLTDQALQVSPLFVLVRPDAARALSRER